MLKSELEAIVAQQRARIAELEAQAGADNDEYRVVTVDLSCTEPVTEIWVRGYLVFAGNAGEAEGGWGDYRQCFAGEEQAREFAGRIIRDEPATQWAQIVELPTGRMEWYDPD